jgi:hypothetical protein
MKILGTDHPLYQKAPEKYLKGKSLRVIAREEKCSYSTVRVVLLDCNIPLRPIGVHQRPRKLKSKQAPSKH